MYDVTYIMSPLIRSLYPIAPRILYQNLKNDKNINVTFDTSFTESPFEEYKPKKKRLVDYVLESNGQIFPPSEKVQNEFINSIVKKTKTDLVLFTFFSIRDAVCIRPFLENGKRMVIGGPGIRRHGTKKIREKLEEVIDKSLLKNVILVDGYVDLRTDISKIIGDWVDTEIIAEYPYTIWDCNADPSLSLKQNKGIGKVNITFGKGCWYKKCRFCNITWREEIELLNNIGTTEIIDSILKLSYAYKSRHIHIADSFLPYTSRKINDILSALSKHGLLLSIYTGIQYLKKSEYIKWLNQYKIHMIKVGIESTIDNTLSIINKGILYDDVLKFQKLAENKLNRRTCIFSMFIADLPHRSEKEAIKNIKNITRFKESFRNINNVIKLAFLQLGNDMYKYSKPLLEKVEITEENVDLICGWFRTLLDFNNNNIDDCNFMKNLFIPFIRRGTNGEIIKSDMRLMSIEEAKLILKKN